MALEEFQHFEQKPPPGVDVLEMLRNEADAAVTYVDFKKTMQDIEEELQHLRGRETHKNGGEDKDEKVRDLEAIQKELNSRYEQKFGRSLQ